MRVGSNAIEITRSRTTDDDLGTTIQDRWSAEQGTGEHRPVSDLVDADLLARGVTCRVSREWVECAPRRRVARPGRRPSVSCEWLVPAARSRLGSWISDEGLALKNQARRRRTLAVSFPDAPTRLASLCLPYSAACRCSPVPAYSRG